MTTDVRKETDHEEETDPRYRLKRMRADHNFHPTMSLLEKALKFQATFRLARENKIKFSKDDDAQRMAREFIRHTKHWYTCWNEYRTNLGLPPSEREILEVAKTPNGQVVQAAKLLGWAVQAEWDTKDPAKKLLRAALALKSDPGANREHLDTEKKPETPQSDAGVENQDGE